MIALGTLRPVASRECRARSLPYDLSLQGRTGLRALRGGADGVVVSISPVRDGARIDVLAAGRIDDQTIERSIAAGRGLAGLDDDPEGFAELAARHPLTAC